MSDRFIGRENELKLLKEQLNEPSAAVMVYGKRKVGKTTLITTALGTSADDTVYYECLKSTMADNVKGFVKVLTEQGVIPFSVPFDSFVDVFAYLDSFGKTINIVIDEYPYLKEMTNAETVDSIFQTVVDNSLSHIRLFISGSHIGMMKDMLAEKNALYGRFSLILRLGELDYRESSLFYNNKTAYDKIAFYSVFGGSPFVNEFIDAGKDLKTNIINTILNPYCPVYSYAEHLLISDYANSVNAERILCAVSNGRKKYGEIEDILDMKNNGLLSKQLSSLLKMEIVSKRYPINKRDDKKKTSYELSDNLLRFYYAFVYKNKSALTMLGAEAFYNEYIENAIVTFISRRFEEICRTYFSLRAKRGKLPGVTNIGTYWYDDAATRTNGEFDVVLERHGVYDVYEVKYFADPLDDETIREEERKIKNIKGLTLGRIGLISASGFDGRPAGYEYIDGEMLYDE